MKFFSEKVIFQRKLWTIKFSCKLHFGGRLYFSDQSKMIKMKNLHLFSNNPNTTTFRYTFDKVQKRCYMKAAISDSYKTSSMTSGLKANTHSGTFWVIYWEYLNGKNALLRSRLNTTQCENPWRNGVIDKTAEQWRLHAILHRSVHGLNKDNKSDIIM